MASWRRQARAEGRVAGCLARDANQAAVGCGREADAGSGRVEVAGGEGVGRGRKVNG